MMSHKTAEEGSHFYGAMYKGLIKASHFRVIEEGGWLKKNLIQPIGAFNNPIYLGLECS